MVNGRMAGLYDIIRSDFGSGTALDLGDLDDSATYTYDSLYRLTKAAGPASGLHSYRYDPIGNMLERSR